ncbi:MAG: hypothetical protein A2087_07435 [Spirochaetes bacterium GWD1_61_31]|nr:MAG: hypothetical protein A2Y37_08040 [Spirochaetes bacterium GWB1_60_80]OHD34243.1 MAG: hypothetical protein A2004_12705 [Spirochaetes bacterium GWC1_61_12]OHD40171.1 MAG: hypothetical protein A2087_07435 [Spirochaetes bacterium GWD1_61_31]OHD45781.1 MAG: hypothetical protein A2Y35_03675 [Spirochaetes bacterium GWE1_60_18]OHD58325.1 MAG: hypothetical protein A2Y32_06065 [Spirochaetes bacterium GWF1_60_12]
MITIDASQVSLFFARFRYGKMCFGSLLKGKGLPGMHRLFGMLTCRAQSTSQPFAASSGAATMAPSPEKASWLQKSSARRCEFWFGGKSFAMKSFIGWGRSEPYTGQASATKSAVATRRAVVVAVTCSMLTAWLGQPFSVSRRQKVVAHHQVLPVPEK